MEKKLWAGELCLRGTNILHRGDAVWNMMSIPAGQEQSELNSKSKKLQLRCMPTTPKWYMKQQQELAMVFATTF
jgi:hypothetical protein